MSVLDLVNRTPLAAALLVTDPLDGGPRLGIVVAKATYTIGADQQLELDTQAPLPVLDDDEETDLGLIPRDDLPREDGAFEVILLGKAHTPGGRAALRTAVKLQVGAVRRELAVFGDRVWQGQGKHAQIGEAAGFTEMPLTWDRAFGGSCEVEIDREATVTVDDPRNPAGRGFDPEPRARHLGKYLAAPRGYPRLPEVRPLPNLEDPAALIGAYDEEPRPACWATVPMTSYLHVERGVIPPTEPGSARLVLTPGILHRAHPDWVIARPGAGAPVVLEGAHPDGPLRFALPELRVIADYQLGAVGGQDDLMPQLLLLLPEQRRCVLVYRLVFNYPFARGQERTVRLRTEAGWYPAPAPQQEVAR